MTKKRKKKLLIKKLSKVFKAWELRRSRLPAISGVDMGGIACDETITWYPILK